MACKDNICVIDIKPKVIDIKPKVQEPHLNHHHNCNTCHSHSHHEDQHKTRSIVKKIHEHNGHQCTDDHCDIKDPHGHNQLPQSHKHNHHHDQFPIWPLEDFIAHTKIPQGVKEFLLNVSFLSPALITTNILTKLPLPKFLKTWLSITAMHGLNRGKQKISRLGLTYLVSGAASMGSKTNLGARTTRFIATSLIAIIEKFSSNGHHNHKKEDAGTMIKNEFKVLTTNIKDLTKWKELLPSLLNIETKVQLVAPMIRLTINKLLQSYSDSVKNNLGLISNILFTSLGFVGVDKLLLKLIKPLVGDQIASSISSICGCCGSPVCSAAATDAALMNSL